MAMRARHGDCLVGQRSRLHSIWTGLRQRCSNPKATGFADYGGRGITVDPDWDTFESFKAWAEVNGYANNLSIERRNVNLDYDPSNCYWATTTIQACNKRKRVGQKSQFIGVAPNHKNWQANVSYKGLLTYLGTFPSEVQAAQVRDDFIKANGLPHKLNF